MFMFVPSFLFCDPPGVLGLDNLLGYRLEAMSEVPSTCPEAFPLAATQEDQGGQDGMQQRAYPVPGCTCSWNASGIKMLEKRADHEGGFHPCDKTRQGTGGNNETP
jgi:hypothetical protein